MTENELKKTIEIYKKTLEVIADNGETCFCELDKNILSFLEELDKHRAIGTIEEFKRAKEMEAVYEQVKWERDVAISQLEEIGVGLGQKMDEFKDLKEKNEPKKPKDRYKTKNIWDAGYCPTCGCGITARWDYCQKCSQHINWQ